MASQEDVENIVDVEDNQYGSFASGHMNKGSCNRQQNKMSQTPIFRSHEVMRNNKRYLTVQKRRRKKKEIMTRTSETVV